MAILWNDSLSVGINQIDMQHKQLIERANQLFEAGKAGKTKEMIGEMLDFLEQYTKTHFADEEKYMMSIRYPDITTQKREHTEFIASLQNLKKEFNQSGGNLLVIINANKLVVDWLTKHISVQDKKIGQFVNK